MANYSTWPRGGADRRPTAMIRMIVGRYSVGERHWDVFVSQCTKSIKPEVLANCPGRNLFYLWIQTYNQHEANIREYCWVMRGCR